MRADRERRRGVLDEAVAQVAELDPRVVLSVQGQEQALAVSALHVTRNQVALAELGQVDGLGGGQQAGGCGGGEEGVSQGKLGQPGLTGPGRTNWVSQG